MLQPEKLARLQQALSHMATKLEERASYLRDFTRHLSHEFKTPIASIRAAVELIELALDEKSPFLGYRPFNLMHIRRFANTRKSGGRVGLKI